MTACVLRTIRMTSRLSFQFSVSPLFRLRPVVSHPYRYLNTNIRPLATASSSHSNTSLSEISELHSQPSSSPNLLAYIKQKSVANAVRKIVTAVEEAEQGIGGWSSPNNLPDAIVYRTAIRSLLKAHRTDLAILLYRLRMTARSTRTSSLLSDAPLAASVIRAVLRDCKKRGQRSMHAADVFAELRKDVTNVARNSKANTEGSTVGMTGGDKVASKTVSAFFSVTGAFLMHGDFKSVQQGLQVLKGLRGCGSETAVPIADYNNIIRLLGKSRMLNGVFTILDVMRDSGVKPDNETFEFLANAAVRQVQFVLGAVSMDTLPKALGAEVAFVGRSNVGKSSLVNMVCNRKALAYVSGRPGKTQQFNYFLVNEKDKDSQFYMVDLPGVGYAKVPKQVQEEWMMFMQQYLHYRSSLTCVFHLIDARHGALADDEQLMAQVSMVDREFNYVIVLTKADKLDKQKVKQVILDKTRAALIRNNCPSNTPIVLTSASTRLGRDEMWKHLQSALEPISAESQ